MTSNLKIKILLNLQIEKDKFFIWHIFAYAKILQKFT